ncbi:hypothetical protein Hoch_1229 [Haliangium ochraceum DSM 14365]|uniref:Uncharacterized protein n=2 Tax=Haliangium ochraceum TaxID=80816 RepID=D0LT96_HALO1|nr:hypothetical protein Hoch_1229 [Haliangium ochraceum DSM 14365]
MPSQSSVQYDATVIETMAKRLLKRAGKLVALYAFFGLLLGAILLFTPIMTNMISPAIGLVGILITALIGYSIGQERAFTFKLQAHTLLCQVSIERHLARMATIQHTATNAR